MPIDTYLPKIDDRRYDDIMAEVRTRIARYTPEWSPVWTDVNESDPGITMLEVFAWMTDLLLYRMNRVPELNYLKFLELIGIELQPAQSAQVEVTFPVLASTASASVIVPGNTQLSADPGDGGPPLIFETDRALVAIRPRLAAVLSYDGFSFQSATLQNETPGQSFQPFGPLARINSALHLGFDASTAFPGAVEINLAFWPGIQTGHPSPVSCDLPQTTQYPQARLNWECWNGTAWQSVSLLKDETVGLTRIGHVYLKAPAQDVMQPMSLESLPPMYWLRARIAGGSYERPPSLLAARTNTTSARQAETIRDEVMGGSDGTPNQTFPLQNTPVLAGSLQIEVDEGDGFQQWTEMPDFLGSKASDRHYVLNRSTGEVRFGDGVNGSIPVANVDNPGANVVARVYRFGGGPRGNVKAGVVSTLLTSIPGIDETAIGNLQPAFSGRAEETLDAAKKRAPAALKSRDRAVTSEDFETLAKQAANVKRAQALPLSHPDFPGVRVPGVITVVVVPDAPEGDPKPVPTDGTLRTVCAYLNERRLLTTELYVTGPTYLEVSVEVDLIAANDADLGEVKTAVEASLLDYFHPLRGGEKGEGWPFGGNIFYSRVYQRVFSAPGVERIERLVITLDGEAARECTDVDVPDGVLLFNLGNTVEVRYAFDD
jgi:predicted phage baseplate assembly protein